MSSELLPKSQIKPSGILVKGQKSTDFKGVATVIAYPRWGQAVESFPSKKEFAAIHVQGRVVVRAVACFFRHLFAIH